MKPTLLLFSTLLLSGLVSAKDAQPAQKQGFHLQVRKLVGNHMPGPVPEIAPKVGPGIGAPGIGIGGGMNPAGPGGFPLKETEVLVFKGKIKPMKDPVEAKKQEAFLKQVVTDDEGKVSIPLPAGRYTLVAVIKGKCYRNGYDGQGNWSSLELSANTWMDTWIKDTSEAAF